MISLQVNDDESRCKLGATGMDGKSFSAEISIPG